MALSASLISSHEIFQADWGKNRVALRITGDPFQKGIPMKKSILGGTAAAIAFAGLAVLAPSAASADVGAHHRAPLTVCGADAGAAITVEETPAARETETTTVTAGADGCATVSGSGVATTSIVVTSGDSEGRASFQPSVRWNAATLSIEWQDNVVTGGDIEAPSRTFDHVDALRESVPATLTLTH